MSPSLKSARIAPLLRKPATPSRHRIYTKTGDTGQTGLFGAGRVSKAHPRIDAYGEADELSAILGLARSASRDRQMTSILATLQDLLFVVGAILAAPKPHPRTPKIGPEDTKRLEDWIDLFDEELPPLRRFVLPGGTALAAWLHLGRTACRRAERSLISLHEKDAVDPEVVRFMNRLSDLLFTMARAANHRAKKPEIEWVPERQGSGVRGQGSVKKK